MRKTIALVILFLVSSFQSFSHPGIGIVEDSKGNIFYTDLDKVWQISLEGQKHVVVNDVHTHELYIDDRDNLYGEHLWYDNVHDKWSHFVWKYSFDGKYEKVIPNSAGFLSNYSFVRDHQGRMYWANRDNACQKVMRSNADHSVLEISDPCFKNIRWMNSSPTGDIYVVDFQDIKKIDNAGKIRTVATQIYDKQVAGSNVNNQNSVMGVWGDRQGNIFAAIYATQEVKKFSLTGKEEVVAKIGAPWSPSGGLVDAKGTLWILENSTTNIVRVEKIDSNGRRTIY